MIPLNCNVHHQVLQCTCIISDVISTCMQVYSKLGRLFFIKAEPSRESNGQFLQNEHGDQYIYHTIPAQQSLSFCSKLNKRKKFFDRKKNLKWVSSLLDLTNE